MRLTVIIVMALTALLWSFQRRMMYFPTSDVPSPAAMGLADVDPVTFQTPDGLSLAGWFFRTNTSPTPTTVLVFNGNGGNRAYRAPLAEALQRRGFQVLLFDYRGYGENGGSPSEEGLAHDSRAARAYLLGRPDVDARRLTYFGESLGSGVAVELAANHPPRALILRSPFTSMADIGQHHYPVLPVRLLLRDRYDSASTIERVSAPLLIIAGDRDRIVPVEYSRRLFDAAREPKSLVIVHGADHNDQALLAGAQMIEAVVDFLAGL